MLIVLVVWLIEDEVVPLVFFVLFLFEFLEGTHRLFPIDGFCFLMILLRSESE